MSKYRNALPQLNGTMFLTDSGLETILYFVDGFDMPEFASFPLLETEKGRARIKDYYETHMAIAKSRNVGFILDTPTWRASSDWGTKLGYSAQSLDRANREAVQFMLDLRDQHETPTSPIVVSGELGPRGDGYNPSELLEPDAAQAYHADQMASFAAAGADMVTALTITHVGEAVGITRAAQSVGIPVVISFTTATDGCLPTGQTLGQAIEETDAATENGPTYYMINCAHPTHFQDALDTGAAWVKRIRGMRANASSKSHEELDNSSELDSGDPVEFAQQYRALRRRMDHISVLGGCCGTDHRHIEEIGSVCA
ncbi:MAG: homocysteine S-methyltransferase [Rhodospirillaceae bacterium]|jgi:homocysteine S-methyltransferase|nr:homocysteine S-methyltransferase [Rhodospirillaceae bacterium]